MLRWRRWCCAVILAPMALALAAAGAQAQDEAPASVELVGATTPELLAKPLEVNLDPPEGEEAGLLQVPLVARQKGALEVEYVDLKSGKAVPVTAPSAAGEAGGDGLAISGELPEAPLAAGQLYLLRLVFTPPKDEAEALEGALKIGIAGGLPVTRTVAAVPAGQAKPGWTPAQKKVEVSVTRLLPFTSTPDVSRSVGVTPGEPGQAGGEEPLARRYLSFSKSGNGTVTIGAPEEAKPTPRSQIEVTGASGVGTASTTVDLGGEAKPSQEIEVVVQVGDAIWFPLFVIIAGALLGKLLPTWWDIWRQGELLAPELRKAIAAYKEAKEGGDGPDSLDGRLTGFEATAKQLEGVSRASTLEEASAAAKSAIDQLEGWIAVRKALANLAKAVSEAKPVLGTSPASTKRPLLDSSDLLERSFTVSGDLAQSERWAKAIALQAEALQQYAAICTAAALPNADGADEWQQLKVEALQTYLAAGPPLSRSPRKAELLVETLRQIHGWKPGELGAQQRAAVLAMAASLSLRETALPFPFEEVVTRAFEWFQPKGGRSQEEVMARVRTGDWAIFLAVLLVSALAYLLPVYAGGPFGTWQQYLAAFVAGAGTQVAVTGVAVPIARSMKAGGEGKAAAAGGGTPAPAAT